MNIRIYDTYDQMSRAAADFVIAQLLLKPESHIGLTAGKTPVGMFAALVDSYRSGAVGFGQATFYNLEEKFGLAADDPATCRNYFHRHLLDHTDITDDQLLLPDQPADDLAQACAALGRDLTAPKGITFSWQTDPHPLPDRALSLDRTAFLRAAENLLSNGVRYTPAGQTLDCGLRLTAQRLFLWVQDSGPGFSPEALAKAGKLFYTEEPSRPQGGHLGMGLYSAAQTARAHGGGLCLENTSRGGRATLWISIS